MGIVKRQGSVNTIISYVGALFGALNGLFLATRFLDEAQKGFLVDFLPYVTIFVAQFSALGGNPTIIRFLPFFRDKGRQHHGFLFYILAVATGGFLLFSLIYILFQDIFIGWFQERSPLITEYYWYTLLIGFFGLNHLLLETYSNTLFKSIVPSIIRELLIKIGFSILLVLFHFEYMDFPQLVAGFVWLNGLMVFILVAYLIYLGQFHLKPIWSFRLRKLWRTIAVYSGYNYITTVNSWLYQILDIMMVAALSSGADVGIYGLPLMFLRFAVIPTKSMNKLVIPLVAEHWKNNRPDQIQILYKKSALVNLITGGCLLMLLCVNGEVIFETMTGRASYLAGVPVLYILSIARLYDLATGLNTHIINSSKLFRINLLFTFATIILSITTNSILIPIYGLEGAAMATALSIIVINSLQAGFVWWKFGMQPFSKQTLWMLIILALCTTIGFLLPITGYWLVDLGYRSAIIGGLFILLVLRFNISPDFSEYFGHLLRRLKLGFVAKWFNI
ncbi:MAG: polysaccharide biosynthesis C-terminal domain-containing protein [Bacteroidota bacterium]